MFHYRKILRFFFKLNYNFFLYVGNFYDVQAFDLSWKEKIYFEIALNQ